MSTAPPPVTEPDPSTHLCPGDKVGPCSRCRRSTWKYGSGGCPLCTWCFEQAKQRWGPTVRYVSTRP